jgi:hypothetical protein
MKTLLTRTSPSSEKPSDKLPGRKYLWLATPATQQIGQDRNNASSSSQGVADARSRVRLRTQYWRLVGAAVGAAVVWLAPAHGRTITKSRPARNCVAG